MNAEHKHTHVKHTPLTRPITEQLARLYEYDKKRKHIFLSPKAYDNYQAAAYTQPPGDMYYMGVLIKRLGR